MIKRGGLVFSQLSEGIAKRSNMTQKFNLKWNEFQNNVNVAFKALRLERDFSDVSLACEDATGQEIEAHKLILAASSPLFQKLLRASELKQPLVLIRGVSLANLVAIVDFLYHGEVNILQENLESFLELSEELQLKGLRRSIKGKEQIRRNISVEIKDNSPTTIDEKENDEDDETMDDLSSDRDDIIPNTHIYFDDEIVDDQTPQAQTADEIRDDEVAHNEVKADGGEDGDVTEADNMDGTVNNKEFSDDSLEKEVGTDDNTDGDTDKDNEKMQEDGLEDGLEDGDDFVQLGNSKSSDTVTDLDDSKENDESFENVTKYENAFESFILDPEKGNHNSIATSIVADELVSKVVVDNPDGDVLLNLDAKIKSMMEKGQNYISNGKRRALAQICKMCGKEGLGKNIQDHIEANHIEGIKLPCYYCEKTFTSRNGLRLHKKKIHTQSTGELIDSLLRMEEEKITWKLDVTGTSGKMSSTKESESAPDTNTFSEENHNEKVDSMIEQDRNQSGDERGKYLGYLCKVCGKVGRRCDLKTHIEVHHIKGVSIPCNFCDKTFKTMLARRVHKKKLHIEGEEREMEEGGKRENEEDGKKEMGEGGKGGSAKLELEEELSADT